MISTVGFVAVTTGFSLADYKAEYTWVNKDGAEETLSYMMPALFGPMEAKLTAGSGMEPLLRCLLLSMRRNLIR